MLRRFEVVDTIKAYEGGIVLKVANVAQESLADLKARLCLSIALVRLVSIRRALLSKRSFTQVLDPTDKHNS